MENAALDFPNNEPTWKWLKLGIGWFVKVHLENEKNDGTLELLNFDIITISYL